MTALAGPAPPRFVYILGKYLNLVFFTQRNVFFQLLVREVLGLEKMLSCFAVLLLLCKSHHLALSSGIQLEIDCLI